MKNILIAGLLIASSAAFALGRNSSQPVNPPQPEIVVESEKGICNKFYNKVIPHYHASDIELAPIHRPHLAMPLKTAALVGADGFCVLMGFPKLMETLCAAAGSGCKTGPEWQFTRPDAP